MPYLPATILRLPASLIPEKIVVPWGAVELFVACVWRYSHQFYASGRHIDRATLQFKPNHNWATVICVWLLLSLKKVYVDLMKFVINKIHDFIQPTWFHVRFQADCVCACVCGVLMQQRSWRKGTVLPDRDTVTFIRLKVTEISIFFIRLSIKLHGGEILCFFGNLYFQAAQIPNFLISLPERLCTTN